MLHAIAIEAAPAKVYRALTTAPGLQGWWTGDAKAQARVRSVAVFGFGGGATVFRMRIVKLAPGKRVEWRCLGDDKEWKGTRLRFKLKRRKGGGTELRFTHAGWRSTKGWFRLCNTTWGALMFYLKGYVETGKKRPLFSGKA